MFVINDIRKRKPEYVGSNGSYVFFYLRPPTRLHSFYTKLPRELGVILKPDRCRCEMSEGHEESTTTTAVVECGLVLTFTGQCGPSGPGHRGTVSGWRSPGLTGHLSPDSDMEWTNGRTITNTYNILYQWGR